MNEEDLLRLEFELPENLIATKPVVPADSCRLLVQTSSGYQDDTFLSLVDYLEPGDLLVANHTRVEARRVLLYQEKSDREFETLFLARRREICIHCWQVLLPRMKKLRDGDQLSVVKKPELVLTFQRSGEIAVVESPVELDFELFNEIGEMPLPPYMKRESQQEDRQNYQNYFAREGSSVASPTASLHFTDRVMQLLKDKQIEMETLLLDVGYGTFAPLKDENFLQKKLHPEYYHISENLAERLAKRNYNRLVAVGTTSLRVLEHIYRHTQGHYDDFLEGETTLFVFPPDRVQSADLLITNFHLPRSSLLLLVSAFAGVKTTKALYLHGIDAGYRFYSYGDAMLLQNQGKTGSSLK